MCETPPPPPPNVSQGGSISARPHIILVLTSLDCVISLVITDVLVLPAAPPKPWASM